MKNICVFCGSSSGNDPDYEKYAIDLGQSIAKKGYTLVYGGGNIGLMGKIADTVLEAGGSVIGVIPEFLLNREVGHTGLTELIVVDSMHTRKQKMAELADAFIAMPGGFGTLEELAEITTWVQLELVDNPVGLLNVNGYYNALIMQFDKMFEEGFTSEANRAIIKSSGDPKALLEQLAKYPSQKRDQLNKT